MDREEGVKKMGKNDKWELAHAAASERGEKGIVKSLDRTKELRQGAGSRRFATGRHARRHSMLRFRISMVSD